MALFSVPTVLLPFTLVIRIGHVTVERPGASSLVLRICRATAFYFGHRHQWSSHGETESEWPCSLRQSLSCLLRST